MDSHAALACELRGRTICVDMTKSFDPWPSGARHPSYVRLVDAVNKMLKRSIPDPVQCKKFKKSDFALFVSLWWPYAAWEDLYSMTLFTVCFFVWDDTIDTNEHFLAPDFDKANLWRRRSLEYFEYHLGLSKESSEPECPDNICLLFKEFGQRFRGQSDQVQRQKMFSRIQDIVRHSMLEQGERLAGRIPDYEQYKQMRFGVTGVRMFSLLLEIANQSALPAKIMDSPEIKAIVEECNFIIIVVNDILSLKKEIATDYIINLVPILSRTGKPLDFIISDLVHEMHSSIDRLDSMAAKLSNMTRGNSQLHSDVMKFIDGIRIMDTGTLAYSIESPRYGIGRYQLPDGTLEIVL